MNQHLSWEVVVVEDVDIGVVNVELLLKSLTVLSTYIKTNF